MQEEANLPWGATTWVEERPLSSMALEDVLFFLNSKVENQLGLSSREQGRKRRILDAAGETLLELELPFWSQNFEVGEWPIQGRDVFFLFRAGSAALGLCEDRVLVEHKCFQRYVVRGKGKAQPSHLRTKGKSRYGSRLRLQNFDRLIEESIERLRCWAEDGPLHRVFLSCPERLLSDLLAANPPFPIDKADPRLRRLPIHVHEPRFAELERVRAWTQQGWLRYGPSSLQHPDLIGRVGFLLEIAEEDS